MKNSFLAKPDKEYQRSFERYALSYKDSIDKEYFNKYKKALEDFKGYLNDLYNHSEGKNLLPGYVKCSTFWLIDNDEVVGVVRVRHEEVECAGHIGYDISPNHRMKGYGTRILQLALDRALEIGLDEVIVTCNINNDASKKVIEKNDGQLLGTVFDEEENEDLYKYSISLTNKK